MKLNMQVQLIMLIQCTTIFFKKNKIGGTFFSWITVTIGHMWKISLRHTVYNITKFIISKLVNFAPVYALTSCSCIYNLTTTSYSSVWSKYFEIVMTVFTLNPCSDNIDFRPLSLPPSNANFKCFKHSPQFANVLAIGCWLFLI